MAALVAGWPGGAALVPGAWMLLGSLFVSSVNASRSWTLKSGFAIGAAGALLALGGG